jgi:hypothetical protein
MYKPHRYNGNTTEDSVIRVEFVAEPGGDVEAAIRGWAKVMPWMKYLVDNHTGFDYSVNYHAAAHQTIATLKFMLPPEKETFYNLKYR